jgi:hypothetical protein
MENLVERVEALTPDQQEKIGEKIGEFFHIRKNREGYYMTDYGQKTARGLAQTFATIIATFFLPAVFECEHENIKAQEAGKK